MVALLSDTWQRVLDVNESGAGALGAEELVPIRAAYDTIIAAGHVANPLPPPSGRRATAWLAVRSYLATVMKNDVNPLGALQRLMVGDPWLPPTSDSS